MMPTYRHLITYYAMYIFAWKSVLLVPKSVAHISVAHNLPLTRVYTICHVYYGLFKLFISYSYYYNTVTTNIASTKIY